MLRQLPILTILAVFASSDCIAGKNDELAVDEFTHQVIEVSDGQKSFLCSDVNSDGHVDLVVAEESRDRIVVFINDGTGSLVRNADYPAGERPTSLSTLDFNDDGYVDLAIANHEVNSITLLRGSDAATFEAAKQSPILIASQPHAHMIKTADVDSDGILDLVVDSRDQFGIYVLRGNAKGDFDSPGHSVDVGGAPYLGFAVSDLNNDQKPDFIAPNQNDLSVILNRSSKGLTFERKGSIPFRSPFAVGTADLNGDKNIDLVVAGVGQMPGIVTFAGDGAGNFKSTAVAQISQGAKLISTGDVNGDGYSDAVITSWNEDMVLLIGSAAGPSPIQLPPRGIRNPWGLAIADFNNDGLDEIVVGDAASNRVHIYSIARPAN